MLNNTNSNYNPYIKVNNIKNNYNSNLYKRKSTQNLTKAIEKLIYSYKDK